MCKRIIFLLLICPFFSLAQKSVTIKIEELKRPDKLLDQTPVQRIYESMIMSDMNKSAYEVEKNKLQLPYQIIARSKDAEKLVSYGYNPFFNGMYQAYADHRPFVLSPDMVWLLISQGFAHHINSDPEKYRKYLTNQSGKTLLVINNDALKLDDPNSPWEKAFPEFTGQLDQFAGPELRKIATADFTTTTKASLAASQITLMEAVKPYFEFVQIVIACGIPEVTLEGTSKDWQKVLDKARYLRKYELDWWMDELEPVLQEFVKASKGQANVDFWRNMFKYHTLKQYGAPKVIDGWIVKFFPYDKTGKRYGLKELYQRGNLPAEMVKVDLRYIETNGKSSLETPLEMWAGFVGLEQNDKTYALKPKIGWMIRKKDTINVINQGIEASLQDEWSGGINIRVKAIPKEVLDLKEVNKLEIYFLDGIRIPDELGKIKIRQLILWGTITESEITRICKLLPKTMMSINNKYYNEE